jgi:hypothetical protein
MRIMETDVDHLAWDELAYLPAIGHLIIPDRPGWQRAQQGSTARLSTQEQLRKPPPDLKLTSFMLFSSTIGLICVICVSIEASAAGKLSRISLSEDRIHPEWSSKSVAAPLQAAPPAFTRTTLCAF